MKFVKQGLVGSFLIVIAVCAYADNQSSEDISSKWFDDVYVGVGLQNSFGYASVETDTPYARVYGRLGLIYKSDPAVQLGFRKAYHLIGHDQDGYYMGGFVGHMGSMSYFSVSQNSEGDDILNRERENRMGIGAEFAYLWHNSQRSNAASVSLGYLKAQSAGEGSQKKEARSEPIIMFSYTFQVKFF